MIRDRVKGLSGECLVKWAAPCAARTHSVGELERRREQEEEEKEIYHVFAWGRERVT